MHAFAHRIYGTHTFAAAVGQRVAVVIGDGGDGVTDSEVVGQSAYTLREEKSDVRHRWVIERADGSVCFRLARNEWSLAEEILHNLLHGSGCEENRRDAA
jgi:hypothetical protein